VTRTASGHDADLSPARRVDADYGTRLARHTLQLIWMREDAFQALIDESLGRVQQLFHC
jgi:hypothetical protein